MQVWAGSIIGALLGMIWYGLFETEAVRELLISLDTTLNELERARKVMLCLEESNNNGTKIKIG